MERQAEQRPPDYIAPSSPVELLRRYAHGERYFVGARLEQARLVAANLSGANLAQAHLGGADLSRANLTNVVLDHANMRESSLFDTCLVSSQMQNAFLYDCRFCNADLSNSILRRADFWCADLDGANLSHSDLSYASLRFADLTNAKLVRATLTNANLIGAQLVNTVLDGADISGSRVFGVSAWSVSLDGTTQKGLVITDRGQSTITVDDLEVAQFVHLLLRNQNLRRVIETVTSKMVLILGRFTRNRKPVLQLIKERLDQAGYLAVLFDFDKPASRDLTETVRTLAHLAKFIIADLTEAKSVPQELTAVVPILPSVAVKPIIAANNKPWETFEHFRSFPWVLPIWEYNDLASVEREVMREVITPLEDWHRNYAKSHQETDRDGNLRGV